MSKGIPAAKITTLGKGESQPVATNKTKEGRAKNRRVDIEFKGVTREVIKKQKQSATRAFVREFMTLKIISSRLASFRSNRKALVLEQHSLVMDGSPHSRYRVTDAWREYANAPKPLADHHVLIPGFVNLRTSLR